MELSERLRIKLNKLRMAGLEYQLNCSDTGVELVINETKGRIGKLVIPDEITTIKLNYLGSIKIGHLVLPDNMKEVDWRNCIAKQYEIEEITLGKNCERLGEHAFSYTKKLKKVNLNDGLREIGTRAFECSGIREIHIPDSVRKLGDNVFGCCVELQKIRIPDNITEIPTMAFLTCKGLKEVELPKQLKHIGASAFNGCNNLKTVDIPEDCEGICGSGLEEVALPNKVKILYDNLFLGATS